MSLVLVLQVPPGKDRSDREEVLCVQAAVFPFRVLRQRCLCNVVNETSLGRDVGFFGLSHAGVAEILEQLPA